MVRNFLFHRVSPDRDRLWDPMDVALFDKCISYISSRYHVMLLEDLVSSPDLRTLKNVATILFDDGYKDNIQYAAPILAKYNCKASFYVVTDCIDYNIPTWTHILEHSFQYTNKSNINLIFDFLPSALRVTNLPTEDARMQYLRNLSPFIKTLPHKERNLVIARVRETFDDITLPKIMMDWDDLKELYQAGHYIGSHTLSHCMLGTMSDEAEIKNELLLSGQRIEQHLGYFPKTISYPVGSYNEDTIRLSKEAGYTIGLAVGQKLYDTIRDSLFEIPRIELYNESWLKTKLRILDYIEPLKSIVRPNKNDNGHKPQAAAQAIDKPDRTSEGKQPAINQPVLFSIVVPTYNRAHLLPATIESITAQTYPHYEVIIVDDGSTDNTEEVMQKYLSDKVHYYKKTNAERAAARNYGALKAKGDYINWFDSDDIMFPNHLEVAAEVIGKYNNPEIFAQGHQHQNINGKLLRSIIYPPNINEEMHKSNPIANSPVVVRRDIALSNLFNEDRGLSGSEDYELWLRMAAKYRIYSSPKVTVAVVFHDERSVVTMTSPDQLVLRFTKFIDYITANEEVVRLLGANLDTFLMKNYLLLAVDLTDKSHIKAGRKYLGKAVSNSTKIVFERGFYAFFKHYLKHSLR